MVKELFLVIDVIIFYSRIGEFIVLECGYIYFNFVLKMKCCIWVDGVFLRYIDI